MQRTDIDTTKGGSTTTWDLGTDTTLIRILARNAELLGHRVAMREKNLGIWQETTWSQMHWRDDLLRVSRRVRKRSRLVPPLPEGRRQ